MQHTPRDFIAEAMTAPLLLKRGIDAYPALIVDYQLFLCRRRDLNPHALASTGPQPAAYTNSATPAN